MKWSPQQQAALERVREWQQDESAPQVFRLFGAAGTGKTTLARHAAADVDGEVLYGAFTGKAAHVMRQCGCTGATTLHSLIYIPKDRSRARLQALEQRVADLRASSPGDPLLDRLLQEIHEERINLSRPAFALNEESPLKEAALLVADECSMVDERLGGDLVSFKRKILVLGDPAQLPPVFGGGYFTSDEPDFLLTEIHRQALGNPIIAMAQAIREGEPPKLGQYGRSRVIPKSALDPAEAVAASQILCGRNATRRAINRRVRSLLGLTSPLPVPGDKLVCLRNHHELGLLNGSLWRVVGLLEHEDLGPNEMSLEIEPAEGGPSFEVVAHTQHFLGEELQWWSRKDAEEFDFGYALTVHKAQGSQWDDVLLFDESRQFREHRMQWLYTGVTRARERLTVVQMEG